MPAPRELDPLSSLAAFFGAEVRRLRELSGWRQEELAEKLGWAPSTIASVETARRNPPEDFPEKCDEVYGLPGMLTELAKLVRSVPRWFEHYIELEALAKLINLWTTNLIPGLFQTVDYAKTIMNAGWPLNPVEAIEGELAERMGRQRILEGSAPPQIWAVLHEAAVKQPIHGVEVTRKQLNVCWSSRDGPISPSKFSRSRPGSTLGWAAHSPCSSSRTSRPSPTRRDAEAVDALSTQSTNWRLPRWPTISSGRRRCRPRHRSALSLER
jgi:transcriptional regulator with XRE-family HTH domain